MLLHPLFFAIPVHSAVSERAFRRLGLSTVEQTPSNPKKKPPNPFSWTELLFHVYHHCHISCVTKPATRSESQSLSLSLFAVFHLIASFHPPQPTTILTCFLAPSFLAHYSAVLDNWLYEAVIALAFLLVMHAFIHSLGAITQELSVDSALHFGPLTSLDNV